MILSKLLHANLIKANQKLLVRYFFFSPLYAGLLSKWPACLQAQKAQQPCSSTKLRELQYLDIHLKQQYKHWKNTWYFHSVSKACMMHCCFEVAIM